MVWKLYVCWQFLSTEMTGAACIGKQYSACSAAYTLACRRLRASLGTVSDWRTEQIWIGLPDRIVGLVTMRPTKEGASAYELAGVLRLISGGTTGALVPKKLERVSENAYRYGQLEIAIHSSNYAGHEERVVDSRREQYPATELELQPGAEAVYVASDDPQDHKPGWTSFEQMANSHLPAPSK